MDKAEIAAISVTSTFLAISLIYLLIEIIIGAKSSRYAFTTDNIDALDVKDETSGKVFRKLLAHLVLNNLFVIGLLLVGCGVIYVASGNCLSLLCFLTGALTSLLAGFLAILGSKKASWNLVNLSRRGLREVYRRCLGRSFFVVNLSLSLNTLSAFVLLTVFRFNGYFEKRGRDILKSIAFYAFGTLGVTLYSRLSGGVFSSSCYILFESNLEEMEGNKGLFSNMNNFLQNIYALVLDVIAIVSTLFCTYFLVLGQYTEAGKPLFQSFGYLLFPVILMSFATFVSTVCVCVCSLCIKRSILNRVKKSYFYTVTCSIILTFATIPLFHFLFLPKSVVEVKYNRFVNYGLICIGLLCGMLIAFTNEYFISNKNGPEKSLTLSVISSLTGGIVNSLSYAKLMAFVPTVLVCLNLFVCLVLCEFYGLIFVSLGFMCSLAVVMTGSVFYSLIFTSTHLAKKSQKTDVTEVFLALKSSWYRVSNVSKPLLSTWSTLLGLVLLNHLSLEFKLNSFAYINLFVLISLLIGALFPVLQSGLILRISSGIANWRLKRSNYSEVLKLLYLNHSESFDDEDKDAVKECDCENKDGHVVEIGESEEDYKQFRGGFKTCLLNEAGVEEHSLLNAPITCGSSRSNRSFNTNQFTNSVDSTQHSNSVQHSSHTLNTGESMVDKVDTVNNDNPVDVVDYRHVSRDYRILKNADNHYRMFDEKYHEKHFKLKKRSTIASGSLEQLNSLKIEENEPKNHSNNSYYSDHHLQVNNTCKVEKQSGREGDSLDKVVRRSRELDKEMRRERGSSCASSLVERECNFVGKIVQNDQVHSKEFESDSETNPDSQPDDLISSLKNVQTDFSNTTQTIQPSSNMVNPDNLDDPTEESESVNLDDKVNIVDNGDLVDSLNADNLVKQGESIEPDHTENPVDTTQLDNTDNLGDTSDIVDSSANSNQVDASLNDNVNSNTVEHKVENSVNEIEDEIKISESEIGLDLNINVKQNLLPPDVAISKKPRRPTPKSIKVYDFEDLEEGRCETEISRSKSSIVSKGKNSYQNTLIATSLSLIPLIFALSFPFLVGVPLGKNSVVVAVLFSNISSSIIVQVLSFFSMTLDSTLRFLKAKKKRCELGSESEVIDEIDVKNSHICKKLSKILNFTIEPVLNTMIMALPLICLLGSGTLEKFSNHYGFPRWSNYQ